MNAFPVDTWKEVEHRLSQVMDATPVPMFILDSGHTVTHWNQACADLSGARADEMVGTQDAWRVFHATPRPVLADLVLDRAEIAAVRALYGGKAVASAFPGGGWEEVDCYSETLKKWLSLNALPLFDLGGRLAGALEIVHEARAVKFFTGEKIF